MKTEQEIMDEIVHKITNMLDKHDATLIAGALTALGLQIYKTLLNQKEYAAMQKHILKRSNQIQPFTERKLH
jgi:hypothetical protein|tara:strand:+ start:51 stop:266 length:216 start_codon:yes stop_codon:yes gene_type:complete